MTQHPVSSDVHPPQTAKPARPKFHRPGEDLAAAMECQRCREQGITTPPGWPPKGKPAKPEPTGAKPETPNPRRMLPISAHQGAFLREVWERVAAESAGDEPDSRLLALTCALRGAIRGYANLIGQDLKALRLEDSHAALTTLVTSGWLGTTPETVLDSEPMHPAVCDIPTLRESPWDIGQGIRSRASGWVTRVLAHKKLRKKPNRLRLVAAYLPANASPEGEVSLKAESIVRACALTGTEELTELLDWLARLEWIDALVEDGGAVRARLTELTMPMAPLRLPPQTPPRTAPATTPPDVPVAERADGLLSGREAETARWVAAYRDEHGHGPSWGIVAEAFGWPPRRAPDHDVTQEVFHRLEQGGWLTGFGVPFGLRPGPAHGAGGAGTAETAKAAKSARAAETS